MSSPDSNMSQSKSPAYPSKVTIESSVAIGDPRMVISLKISDKIIAYTITDSFVFLEVYLKDYELKIW